MNLLRLLRGLVGARVRVGTVAVGEVRGVVFDATQSRVLGLEVVGADRAGRFLPWVAVELDAGGVRACSALFLVDQLESYAKRGAVVLQSVAHDDRREVAGDGLVRVSAVRGTGTEAVMRLSPASPPTSGSAEARHDAARSA